MQVGSQYFPLFPVETISEEPQRGTVGVTIFG